MTPEEVAAGLTEAQREFVLRPFYSAHSEGISRAWLHDTGYWPARVIAKLGLAKRYPIWSGTVASIPTELGLQVRYILKQRTEK